MASYRYDADRRTARIFWRWGANQQTKVLRCDTERDAQRICDQIEQTIQDVAVGRLAVPDGVDVKSWLISGGRVSGPARAVRPTTVADVLDAWRESPPPGLEPSTVEVALIHFRRVGETMLAGLPVASVGSAEIQAYVTTRSRTVQRETIRKELGSLRWAWSWVARSRSDIPPPTWRLADVRLPKAPAARPFRTWAEIEADVARRKLTGSHARREWDDLWLDRSEVAEMLETVRQLGPPWFAPMVAAAAYTGARRSELCRSEVGDWSLDAGMARIRQKKRDRDREFSFRSIPIHPALRQILLDWFAAHPGGSMAFVGPTGQPITWDAAHHHFQHVLGSTKFRVVRGWHVLRHSFASNLAAAGVDQRLIDAWMGHSTEIRLRYQHLRPSDQLAAISAL